MSVEAVDKRLDRRFVEMSQVGCTLARLLTEHERLRVDETESINNDFAFNGLNGVNDDGNSSRGQLLE